jgi:hypothetical protein
MVSSEMQVAIEKMFVVMRTDYAQFMPPSKGSIQQQMNEEYNNSLRYEEGRKYIKVIEQRSVHSFIVKQDDPKRGWRAGDILKAAGWNAPATNFVRGNVLDGQLERVRWTGVN